MNTTEIPAGQLFSPKQIFLAAFIGSPVAGCWCLARNYRQLGEPDNALKWLIWGGGASFIFLLIFCGLPIQQWFPHLMIPTTYSIAFRIAARRIQGDAVAQHLAAGGRLASWWFVVGVSLLFSLGVLGILMALLYLAR